MKFTNLLTGVSIIALTATLTTAPVGFGTPDSSFGIGAQAAFAAGKGNGGDDGDEVRGRGHDKADEMLAERDNRGRGHDDGFDNRGRGRADEVRAVVDNEGRGKPATLPAIGGTTTDDGFRNHGEKVSLFVKIAHALGFGGNVGAQQANFGTPEQKPGNGDAAWGDVKLDVNKDGVINDLDLVAAKTPAQPVTTPPPVLTPTTPTTPPVAEVPPPATTPTAPAPTPAPTPAG